MFSETVSYPAAFAAGLFSFLSPCILPLIPSYFTFITGYSLEELTGSGNAQIRKSVFFSTVSFVLGFSAVFILMGASVSFLGTLIFKYRDAIRIFGGILIVALGVHLTGLIRIRGLESEKRFHFKRKPLHMLGAFIIGMAFGAGWTPCVGPLLGSILVLAGSQETVRHGMVLLGIYSAGLAVPFLVLSLFINLLLAFVRKASPVIKYMNAAGGILLILLGLLLITNTLNVFLGIGPWSN